MILEIWISLYFQAITNANAMTNGHSNSATVEQVREMND